MTPTPILLDMKDNVSKAKSLMVRKKVDQLLVLRDGRLNSVTTSESIVFNLLPPPDKFMLGDWRERRLDVPVENFTLAKVVTNDASDSVNEAYENMERNSSSYSIILNLDEVQGIVTYRDFMRFIADSRSSGETLMYIVGLPEEPFEAEATKAKFSRIVKLIERGLPEISEARAPRYS